MAYTHTNGGEAARPLFSTIPLYVQVKEAIKHRIRQGEYKGGTPIPNENDLAREFNVSSGTMRKALDAVEAEGLLERKQGRGTFVLEQHAWVGLSAQGRHFLDVIAGAWEPTTDPQARSIRQLGARGETILTAAQLRLIGRGANEIADRLERRAKEA